MADRLLEAWREPIGVDRSPLLVAQNVRVGCRRWGQREPAVDPVQPGRDDTAQRQVRVGARVARLELYIGRLCLARSRRGRDAERALTVVGTPDAVGGSPGLRLQAPVRVDRSAGEGDEPWQVFEDARHELARDS